MKKLLVPLLFSLLCGNIHAQCDFKIGTNGSKTITCGDSVELHMKKLYKVMFEVSSYFKYWLLYDENNNIITRKENYGYEAVIYDTLYLEAGEYQFYNTMVSNGAFLKIKQLSGTLVDTSDDGDLLVFSQYFTVGEESPDITFNWFLNSISITNEAMFKVNPIETTQYIAILNDLKSGCLKKDSVIITLNPLTLSAGANKVMTCGEETQFDNPITNYTGSGILTYAWFPPDGLSAANIAQPSAEIIEDRTFTLTVTTPNGCIAKDSVKVTVNPLTATIQNLTVSCGNTAQLSLTTNYAGSDNLIYSWNPSTGLSATNISDPVVTLITPSVYSVEVHTPNDCHATANVNIGTSEIAFNPSICMVTVDENDKNVIVWQRENIAAIDSFYIYRESSIQTEQYDLIGKLPYSATGIFTDITSNARVQSNKYKIAVKDICGFFTDMSLEHKTMHLTINRGIGNTWNLIWEQYIGVPVSSYGIYRGTTKSDLVKIGSSSGSNTTYTDETAPAGDVYYQIEVVLPQCSNLKSTSYQSSRSNIINSASATGIFSESFTVPFIYPNPAFDQLNIKNLHSSNATIMIFDLQGKQLLNKQINSKQIDISNLSKGIYTVKLIESGNVLINKLVKE